jgi:hypothetical protein
MPHLPFRYVQLAMLERFDRSQISRADQGWHFSPVRSDDSDRELERVDSSLLEKKQLASEPQRRHMMFITAPGFHTAQPRPTFYSALIGGVICTGVGMSVVKEVKIGFLWLYFGCVGVAIGTVVSLTSRGKWREYSRYEERLVQHGKDCDRSC